MFIELSSFSTEASRFNFQWKGVFCWDFNLILSKLNRIVFVESKWIFFYFFHVIRLFWILQFWIEIKRLFFCIPKNRVFLLVFVCTKFKMVMDYLEWCLICCLTRSNVRLCLQVLRCVRYLCNCTSVFMQWKPRSLAVCDFLQFESFPHKPFHYYFFFSDLLYISSF